ncbi:hypothetical protein B0J18DRAFT_438928 [Chaetomium sp. MPI-SDFR-AT-0129]|nr:hypothetical protein B0J18DRAFT_438928 [Chaetomium sp. MPI-SDFR-AT-0129]
MTQPPPEVVERIRHKKAQYTRLADTKQWYKFDTIFVDDATFHFVDIDGKAIFPPDAAAGADSPHTWVSRDAWAAFFDKGLADFQVIHQVGPGEFDMVREDEVRAVFSVLYHSGPKGYGAGDKHETGGGHYRETWVRKEGDWFCTDLWMQRLYHRVT